MTAIAPVAVVRQIAYPRHSEGILAMQQPPKYQPATLAALVVAAWFCQSASATHIHVGPVQLNFAAIDMFMGQFHYKHGRYARSFKELGMRISCGDYSDAHYISSNAPGPGIDWGGKDCDFSYRLNAVGRNDYTIDALNGDGSIAASHHGVWQPSPINARK